VRWVANLNLDYRTHGFDITPTFNYQSGNPYGDPLDFPDYGVNGLTYGPDPYTHQFDGLGSLKGPSWVTMNFGVSHPLGSDTVLSALVTNVFTAVHNQGYPWEFPARDQVLAYEDNEFFASNSGFALPAPYLGNDFYPYAPGAINPTREYVFSVSTKL
jgi:hypothetical protein